MHYIKIKVIYTQNSSLLTLLYFPVVDGLKVFYISCTQMKGIIFERNSLKTQIGKLRPLAVLFF